MQLTDSRVELINEEDPFKKIELAGRTCYKSEKNITDESALKFYKNLVKHEHTAMLEHATVVFEVYDEYLFELCNTCKYLNCTHTLYSEVSMFDGKIEDKYRNLVSGNIRAINESNIVMLLKALYNYKPDLVYNPEFNEEYVITPDSKFEDTCAKVVNISDYNNLSIDEICKHQYVTMRFICDRGVTHEFVRHRPFSFAQESSRYVNYAKNDMQFIRPTDFDNWDARKQKCFTYALSMAEAAYNKLISDFNAPPQEARAVLPNAIKTELVVTGNTEEWIHFFNLRLVGTTGKPHPDIRRVAHMAYLLYPPVDNDRNLVKDWIGESLDFEDTVAKL